MFRRKSVIGEVMHEERAAYDGILKATTLKTKGEECGRNCSCGAKANPSTTSSTVQTLIFWSICQLTEHIPRKISLCVVLIIV